MYLTTASCSRADMATAVVAQGVESWADLTAPWEEQHVEQRLNGAASWGVQPNNHTCRTSGQAFLASQYGTAKSNQPALFFQAVFCFPHKFDLWCVLSVQ